MLKESSDTPNRGRKPGAKNRSVRVCFKPTEALDLMIFLRENPELVKKSKHLRLFDDRLADAFRSLVGGIKK
tara:strand:+ start:2667 stop:2882 length:216 start_codon:yes stop_codon:yes gene_type:complete